MINHTKRSTKAPSRAICEAERWVQTGVMRDGTEMGCVRIGFEMEGTAMADAAVDDVIQWRNGY
jgi:hypothetical protein